MKNGENYQKNFWNYNPKKNNCQDFAASLLVGNGLIRVNDNVYKFIKQDAKKIFKNNPEILLKIAKTSTKLAGMIDIIVQGV